MPGELVTVGDTEAEGGYAKRRGPQNQNAEKADELLSDDVGPS
jgi:hypothetical protein